MQFINAAALFALASYVVADTETFGLITIRSGSDYQNTGVTRDRDILAVGGEEYVEGVIDDEGNFKVGENSYVSSNNGNFIISSEKSPDFSIKDGRLTFSGEQGFTISNTNQRLSLPVSDELTYVLKPVSKTGESIPDFSPSGKSDSGKSNHTTPSNTSSSSVVPPVYTQTDNGAAGFAQIGLGAGIAAVAALLL